MTNNMKPYFNGNCLWNENGNEKGLHVQEFLEDLKVLFDKHGIELIESQKGKIYPFRMGYLVNDFGLNGAIINLK